MLLYIGYQSGTDVVIYWLPEWNCCCYILATGVELMMLYIGFRSGTVVIYLLEEWN